jgi:hypothetical protein
MNIEENRGGILEMPLAVDFSGHFCYCVRATIQWVCGILQRRFGNRG